MAADAKGNLYLATSIDVLKIAPGGVVTTFAGSTQTGASPDGVLAINALFQSVSGLAVDASGNVYVADAQANRVRKVSATDGTIAAFAGTGKRGFTGDGGLATGATLNLIGQTPLAVDQKGNVYIGDAGNNATRMVTPSGIISTPIGGGGLGSPKDGSAAKGSVFSPAAGIAIDSSGALYITSQLLPNIYEVDSTGAFLTISGAGTVPPGDGLLANSTSGFNGAGIRIDSNGDLYVADPGGNVIRKLILNSPVSLAVSDGNNQTAPAGSTLVKALRVAVNGRAAIGVPGVTVNFVVTSGSATLSTPSSQTDNNGIAGVGLTLGPAPGDVVVTATIAGSKLAPVLFTVTATASSLTIDSQSLVFSYTAGDPAPAAQTLTLAVQDGGVVPFTVAASMTGDIQWLQIDTTSGSAPASIQVSVINLDMLDPGVYLGAITVTSPLSNTSQSVAVQLTVGP